MVTRKIVFFDPARNRLLEEGEFQGSDELALTMASNRRMVAICALWPSDVISHSLTEEFLSVGRRAVALDAAGKRVLFDSTTLAWRAARLHVLKDRR